MNENSKYSRTVKYQLPLNMFGYVWGDVGEYVGVSVDVCEWVGEWVWL